MTTLTATANLHHYARMTAKKVWTITNQSDRESDSDSNRAPVKGPKTTDVDAKTAVVIAVHQQTQQQAGLLVDDFMFEVGLHGQVVITQRLLRLPKRQRQILLQ